MNAKVLLVAGLGAAVGSGLSAGAALDTTQLEIIKSLSSRGYHAHLENGNPRYRVERSTSRIEVSFKLSEQGITLTDDQNRVFSDGFEGEFPGDEWELFGDPTWGQTEYRPEAFDAGMRTWCAAGGSAGRSPETSDYADDMHALMVYGPFDLRKAGAAELRFSIWLRTEFNRDWAFVLASRNGDDFSGFGASGDTQGWQSIRITFNDFPGFGSLIGEEKVWLAFSFTSDSANTDRGAFLDALSIVRSDWEAARTGNLNGIAFPDDNIGFVVGDHGVLLRTVNAGRSWGRTGIETANPLYAVDFPEASFGWTVGGGSFIAKTSDGGANWSRQESGIAIAQLYGVDFVTADSGWAVGAKGSLLFPAGRLILRTSNGGSSWVSSFNTGGSGGELRAVHFVDSRAGWAVGIDGSSLIVKTTDGRTWTRQTNPGTSRLESVYFTDRNKGWAVGLNGLILRTDNGGVTWTQQNSGTNGILTEVLFTADGTGWITAGGGFLLRSTDGGQSWARVDLDAGVPVDGIDFAPDGTGWLAGWGGVVMTSSDGGNSWRQLAGNTGVNALDLNGVWFTGPGVAVSIGQAGTVIRSSDSGSTWSRIASGVTESLRSLFFVDGEMGWAVGAKGTVIKTTDAGMSWTDHTIAGSLSALTEVFFTTPLNGWVATSDGKILRSNDGGATWVQQYSNPSLSLQSIAFRNEHDGWAVGLGGAALETGDGGTSWARRNLSSDDLRKVRFRNADEGWIVGENGTILATRDGGSVWDHLSSGVQTVLDDVIFTDPTTGWVVGFEGTILRSTDGGEHWSKQTAGTFNRLFSASFSDEAHGLIVGAEGTILRTDNAGIVTSSEKVQLEIPSDAMLVSAYPNPFSNATNIEYEISRAAQVDIRVFNVLGQLVTTLVEARLQPGRYVEQWDGRSLSGVPVASGIYLVRFRADLKEDVRSVVAIR